MKRSKKAGKTLNYYSNNFGYREPYQILVDATFCHLALQNKVAIEEQLKNYLQCGIKLLTTQCIILEAESLGPQLAGATSNVKKFFVHKCGHENKSVMGSDCIKAMVKTSRYIVATQDRNLQDVLRKFPGQALLYLHRSAPILDPPSVATKKAVLKKINKLVNENKSEKLIKQLEDLSPEKFEKPKKKKNKAKNPNPLSCKKKRNCNSELRKTKQKIK